MKVIREDVDDEFFMKLCNCRPGDTVRLIDEHCNASREVYLVCIHHALKEAGRNLYETDSNVAGVREPSIVLVDLSTGKYYEPGSLSRRVERVAAFVTVSWQKHR